MRTIYIGNSIALKFNKLPISKFLEFLSYNLKQHIGAAKQDVEDSRHHYVITEIFMHQTILLGISKTYAVLCKCKRISTNCF